MVLLLDCTTTGASSFCDVYFVHTCTALENEIIIVFKQPGAGVSIDTDIGSKYYTVKTQFCRIGGSGSGSCNTALDEQLKCLL